GSHAWSTYLGGDQDEGFGVATDANGNVYAVGLSKTAGWVSGGWDTVFDGTGYFGGDGYIVKLAPAGDHLWSSYIGDMANAVTVDNDGNPLVVGTTTSSGWTSGGWNTVFQGEEWEPSGFVVKFS